MKCLRSDRGGDFLYVELLIFVLSIELRDNHQHWGNHNRMGLLKEEIGIVDFVRTLLIEKGISQMFWRESIIIVIYSLNWVQLKKGINKKPYKLWYGHKPYLSYFNIFEWEIWF